ncbi:hypothetical protein J1605_004691 [Eschrichtius robustus]|uniref:Uncharacterized protein n=1 Tax=Eschrichtius robustus TaxID=9764 RepID=A0AB34HFV6_ESCRO|nr:hypothetical protein J1605_004691 [Eschrichtius robustus]
MTLAGVRGDGPRPCYSAEGPRPDDAARSAEPRAALGNGHGDRQDGAGSRRRAFLSPFVALPGECGECRRAGAAGGPAVFMLLCCRHRLSSALTPSREWGRERAAGGGRAACGGGVGTIAAGEVGAGQWAWGCWTQARPGRPPPQLRPWVLARPPRGERGSRVHVGRGKWSGRWVASSETLRRRSGRRRLGGPLRPGYLLRRRAAAESAPVAGSRRLPGAHGDSVLFLGGFFVLMFWANAGGGAERGWGGLQLWAARKSPGP